MRSTTNANSLHTNAYDEAVTTPSQESVRRALAIQLIINREWGLSMNENPLQGSFVIDELTDLVEEAVLAEFDRIAERGGGAGCDGDRLPARQDSGRVDGVRVAQARGDAADRRRQPPSCRPRPTTSPPRSSSPGPPRTRSAHSSTALADFQTRHAADAAEAVRRLQDVATGGGNVFAELMAAARVCSLGQLTDAFFEVGGQYRRSM